MMWRAEVTELVLRRYSDGAEPGAPYDGVAIARLDLGRASVGPLLVSGPPLTRDDYRQLRALLLQHGAQRLEVTRHGRLVARTE